MSQAAKRICSELLAKAGVPIDSPAAHSLRVKDQRIWDRVVAQRQLGLGEAYIDGWFECDALDEMLTRLISVDAAKAIPLRPKIAMHAIDQPWSTTKHVSEQFKMLDIITTLAMIYTKKC